MPNNNSSLTHARRSRLVPLTVGAAVLVLAIVSCSTAGSESQSASPQAQTIRIPVEGMSCVSCAARIKRTLKGIEGVQQVEVSLERREAVVQFSPEKVTPERLTSAIDALGYKAGKPRVAEAK